ncbi:hypothetical protein [Microvirga sp. Mcv34]|uniref:hypothetical protein n=1 Tax=Microvirga sp. Mcv34 TaxID=2926016 RepID=UPI0021C6BBAA|nr:hypothetical protein [Microvirga sp. Mcv34]
MLASSQPMFLIWGAERILLYNDSYIHILGQRHPAALGQPIAVVWYDAMDQIGPILDRACRGISTHMRDAAGQVAGMFCACTETSDERLAIQRRREVEETIRDRTLHASDYRV